MLQVVTQELAACSTQRLLYGGDLEQNVGAVALRLDHVLQAANLALDACEALQPQWL